MLDKTAITNQQLYIQDVEYINTKIPGKSFADRTHSLIDFYQGVHGKSYDKLITEDIDKIVTNKLQKLGLI